MERDYANDYDAWLAETGGDTGYGNTIPTDEPNPYVAPPPAPTTNYLQTPTGVPGNQWGLGPGGTEPYDLWYWLNHGVTPTGNDQSIFDNNGQLRPGWKRTANGYERVSVGGGDTPPPTTWTDPTSQNNTSLVPTTSAYDSSNFNWPSYAAPSFVDPGTFDPGPAFSYPEFSYRDFSAPTGEDVLKDPGFQFRLDQGRKALEASAAGKGILRSGGTMKDLLGYGQNFASQEYGNVYNRALSEYDTNRNNAFGTWDANRNNAADAWTKQYGQRSDVYGSNVNRANSLNSFNVNNSQFDFNGRQRQAEQEFQDLYNRWAKEGDWTRDLATFNPL